MRKLASGHAVPGGASPLAAARQIPALSAQPVAPKSDMAPVQAFAATVSPTNAAIDAASDSPARPATSPIGYGPAHAAASGAEKDRQRMRLLLPRLTAQGGRSALPQPALPPEHADLAAGKAFSWLGNSRKHTYLVVPDGSLNDARCLVDELFRVQGQTTLFLNDPSVQEQFSASLELDKNGAPRIKDGPFLETLKSGGVLIINAGNYTNAQLDAFNTLMEEGLLDGEKLQTPPRIVMMHDASAARRHPLSGAQLSRTEFVSMKQTVFPAYGFPQTVAPTQEMDHAAVYLDLGNRTGTATSFTNHVGIDRDQQWRTLPGILGPADSLQPLVLRNVPEPESDPYVWDFLRGEQARGRPVLIEQGLPLREAERRSADKSAAVDFSAMLDDPAAPVCIVTPANIDDTLHAHHGIQDGFPILRPALLDQAHQRFGNQPPLTVYVPELLAPYQWDQLLQYELPFRLVANAGAQVPERYRDRVSILPGQPARPQEERQDGVVILHCLDPLLTDRLQDSAQASRIFVTPEMHAQDLVHSTVVAGDNSGAASRLASQAARSNFQTRLHELVTRLQAGETVKLFGLENNPELESELATLLHPPHYLDVNGERLHFGPQGQLRGKLLVMSADPEILQRHPASPGGADKMDQQEWMENTCQALLQKFDTLDETEIEQRLASVVDLYQALRAKGLVAGNGPPLTYAKVETLFTYLFNDIHAAVDPAQPRHVSDRQVRGLFKDLLISDFRGAAGAQDKLYAELKIWLRKQFPDEMNQVPDGHVDTRRLQDLLDKVNHENDIRENVWQFLNVFDLPTIQALTGSALVTSKQQERQVAKVVLQRVMEQAGRHRLHLPPRLQKRQKFEAARQADTPRGELGGPRYQAYLRQPKMTLEQRDIGKSRLIVQRGPAVFLKGGPGSGKTRQTNALKTGQAFEIDVSQQGTASFSARLAQWASHPGPATLIIDEANLASPEALDMLRGCFVDGTVHVDGKLYPLSDQHRIIFTGNSDFYPGRHTLRVANEWLPTVQFKGVPDSALEHIFIAQLLKHAAGKIPALQSGLARSQISKAGLKIHRHLKAAFPDAALSPRNLEELLAQTLTLMRNFPDQVTALNVDAWMARLAMDVYGACLPGAERPLVDSWLSKTWERTKDAGLPPLPHFPLQTTRLEVTHSTQALADKLGVRLMTHARRAELNYKNAAAHDSSAAAGPAGAGNKRDILGQQAILIEAPAARGKDSVVCAMLEQQGKAYRHINIDPDNLGAFRTALLDAYTTGKALVVSELNMLPSDIIEGELNALLTGQSGHVGHPDFLFIGTINPVSYGGRQTLSPAFINRASYLREGDYQSDELAPIARRIAARIEKEIDPRRARHLAPGVDMQAMADRVALAQQALNQRLAGAAEEYRAGIRQTDALLKDLRYARPEEFAALFDKTHAFYLDLADDLDAVEAGDVDARARKKILAKAESLKRLMVLDHPDWLSYPAVRPMTDQESLPVPGAEENQVLRYDSRSHCMLFDPAASEELLEKQLLTLLRRPLGGDGIGKENSAAGAKEKNAPAPSFDNQLGISGVGGGNPAGVFGYFESGDPAMILLSTGEDVQPGEDRSGPARPMENFIHPDHLRVASIKIADMPATRLNQKTRIGLAIAEQTRPADVKIDGAEAQVFYDGTSWHAETAHPTQGNVLLEYNLTRRHDEPLAAPVDTRAGEPGQTPAALSARQTGNAGEAHEGLDPAEKERILAQARPAAVSPLRTWDIQLELEPALKAKVGKLVAAAPGLSRLEQIRQLGEIFATTFFYGDDDAENLNATNSEEERVRQMLKGKVGVCYEITHTFKMICENALQIPIRLENGHRIQGSGIFRAGHQWIKFPDEQGEIHWFDPTNVVPQSAQFRQQALQASQLEAQRDASEFDDGAPVASPRNNEETENLFQTDFWSGNVYPSPDASVVAAISAEELKLVDVRLERKGQHINGSRGALYYPNVLAGNAAQMFIDNAVRPRKYALDVYIESLPKAENLQAFQQFKLVYAAPLAALARSGVKVYHFSDEGVAAALESMNDLDFAVKKPASDLHGPKNDPAYFAINDENPEFLQRLSDHYYGKLFESKHIGKNDAVGMRDCLIDEWRASILGNSTTLPVNLRFGGKVITVERDVFVDNHLRWIAENDKPAVKKFSDFLQLAARQAHPDNLSRFEKAIRELPKPAALTGKDHQALAVIAGNILNGSNTLTQVSVLDEDGEETSREFPQGQKLAAKLFLEWMDNATLEAGSITTILPELVWNLLFSQKLTPEQIEEHHLVDKLSALNRPRRYFHYSQHERFSNAPETKNKLAEKLFLQLGALVKRSARFSHEMDPDVLGAEIQAEIDVTEYIDSV